MKDERHQKVAPASGRTDVILNTASTERFLRQLQQRRRRYRAERINGKIRAILQRYGIPEERVDNRIRSALEKENVPDHQVETMLQSFCEGLEFAEYEDQYEDQYPAS